MARGIIDSSNFNAARMGFASQLVDAQKSLLPGQWPNLACRKQPDDLFQHDYL
jgi:hypothetical protein